MVTGISPQEASERLNTFQVTRKDHLLKAVSTVAHFLSALPATRTGDSSIDSFCSNCYFFFQTRFDELWRKYVTYSGGEQLFGLPVTDYPELARTKKELGLLQKLYGLYNAVIDGVNGYYDILWTEVDIEKINNELLDFQNRYSKVC